MNHKVHGTQSRHPYKYLDIELLPANENEQKAIDNVRNVTATEEESDVIDNYLSLGLQAVNIQWTGRNRAILKCAAV